MAGTLYLIPNRIGSGTNALDVLPARTVACAHRCKRFLAENAKSARAFLKEIEHPEPIAELSIIEIGHEPDGTQFDAWLAPVLEGLDTAIVSESGCPGVADPGAGLVARAHALGIAVVPLVGPCSIVLTLMASGMNGQNFRFVGYLPVDQTERARALVALQTASRKGETQLFIETPYRNRRMLEAIAEHLDAHTRVTVACDVSGPAERIVHTTAAQCRALAEDFPKLPTVFAIAAGAVRKDAENAHLIRASQHKSPRKPRHHK